MVFMGDFNGHIEGRASNHTNSNGKILLDFAKYWDLKLLPNTRWTFRGRNGDPTFIDYMLHFLIYYVKILRL